MKELQRRSTVRRGEQGRGAHEPDLITPTCWWLELGRTKQPHLAKLEQAAKDCAEAVAVKDVPWYRPAAIVRRTGQREILVMVYLEDLVEALGASGFAFEVPSWATRMPMTVSFGDFQNVMVEGAMLRGQSR